MSLPQKHEKKNKINTEPKAALSQRQHWAEGSTGKRLAQCFISNSHGMEEHMKKHMEWKHTHTEKRRRRRSRGVFTIERKHTKKGKKPRCFSCQRPWANQKNKTQKQKKKKKKKREHKIERKQERKKKHNGRKKT